MPLLEIAVLAGYCSIGGFTARMLYETCRAERFGDPVGIGAVSGIFWPVVLPVFVGVRLAGRYWAWRTAPKRVANALSKNAWPTGPEAP